MLAIFLPLWPYFTRFLPGLLCLAGKHQASETGKYLAILLARTLLSRGVKGSFVLTRTERFVQPPCCCVSRAQDQTTGKAESGW